MMNTTVKASMKFKSKRNASFSKKKSPKPSFKGKVRSMSISRSFLDENIKNAGKADMHRRKSVLNSNETAINREQSSQDNESSLPSSDQENKLNAVEKQERKEATSMLYEKEKKDLQRAHSVLVDEYRRRREIRCKIMSKFGRASAKLKIVLAHNKSWNDPESKVTKKEVIQDVFVAKRYEETSESKRRFAYNRFDDVDRI